ncbi:NAD+ diphosphatase [Psychromicrobium silvestre]|uniref:NAD(+) diphosphatase n=1 Tax=Psychromicrobium silvestre TaxID=1645614 RepID=A0A7Y9S5P2_9MICC|nr:NAD(+) diphosphatase [Psychromicrobium silvestre]NYE95013.1 NAD+ diphosphatase [Psychromicrobium silvestre]
MTLTEALSWQQSLIDRGNERRQQADFLASLSADPASKVLPISHGKTLMYQGKPYYLDAATSHGRLTVYLGLTTQEATLPAGTELLAVELEEEVAPEKLGAPAEARWLGFRQIAAELSPADSQYLIEANAIVNWHRVHTHCPRCGAATKIEASGWVRRCPEDNSEHFPRTDPAIIVAVVGQDDRLLLGGGAGWEEHRYSTLAGFVEPGESLEQAVVREISEEVGVHIHRVNYLGSQSWPFPASLMLGFIAYTDDREAKPDGVEVTRARWFDRAELLSAVTTGEVAISPRISIARSLIEHWYGERIEDVP